MAAVHNYDDLFHFILLAENEATHGYDVWSREYSYANDTLQYHRKGIKLNDYSLYAKAGVAIATNSHATTIRAIRS